MYFSINSFYCFQFIEDIQGTLNNTRYILVCAPTVNQNSYEVLHRIGKRIPIAYSIGMARSIARTISNHPKPPHTPNHSDPPQTPFHTIPNLPKSPQTTPNHHTSQTSPKPLRNIPSHPKPILNNSKCSFLILVSECRFLVSESGLRIQFREYAEGERAYRESRTWFASTFAASAASGVKPGPLVRGAVTS